MNRDEALDELFAAPLNEFTKVRDSIVKRLKESGDQKVASEIKAYKKPNAILWALNQLAFGEHERLERLLEAKQQLEDSQAAGAGEFRAATRNFQSVVAETAAALGDVLEREGQKATPAIQRRLGEALYAIATDEEAAHDLGQGRLTREPAGFGFGVAPASGEPETPRNPKLEKAEAKVASLEVKLKESEAALGEVKAEAEAVGRRVETAMRRLNAVMKELDQAKERVDELS